jgi:putative ABC transport system permease protein
VPTVSKAAAVTAISSVSISATMADDIGGSAVQTLLFAAGAEVRDVLGLKLAWGRFLTPADESIRAAVIGAGLAQHWRLQEGDARTIELNGRAYAVVGVLAPVSFMADVDQSVFISFGMAVRDWSDDGRPTRLVVRTDEGRTASTAAVLPLAIGLGRPVTATVTVPSDLLQAGARVDATLQLAGVAMAILALAVGALGISNVMAISVIQRRIEIGVRRALGQTQSLTALQFLSEGLLIGMVGAAGGVTCGVAFVIGACLTQGWALSLPTAPLVFGVAGSLAVSAAASIYPARMAARVEPLETLRSG